MKENKKDIVAHSRAMSRAFRESILEVSEDELREVLEQEGEDFDELADRGQAAIDRAFRQVPGAEQKDSAEKSSMEGLHRGLGALVTLLRRKKKLSEEELAARARVPVEEVRRIEFDASYTPGIRTVAQLEDFFRLKPRMLAILAGAVRVQRQAEFRAEVQKFAALSSGMGKLSREEKKLLAEFVRLLSDYTE